MKSGTTIFRNYGQIVSNISKSYSAYMYNVTLVAEKEKGVASARLSLQMSWDRIPNQLG